MIVVTMDTEQYNRLAYNAVNYASDRPTYVVGETIRIIHDNIDYLDKRYVDKIIELLVGKDYGADYNHKSTWRLFVEELEDCTPKEPLPSKVELRFFQWSELGLLIVCSLRSNLYYPDVDIVPDYCSLLTEYGTNLGNKWYELLSDSVDYAKLYDTDLEPYKELIEFIHERMVNEC